MKLFEDMQEMGGSINDVVQKIINDMFQEELDDDQVEEIVNKLGLSDMLELDTAYTNGDKEKVADILGPLPQFEYSMGTNRNPTSSAAERPAPRAGGGQQARKKPGTQNTVNTNRNYSGGVQNGVSTTNVDQDGNVDQEVSDEEQVEEAKKGSFVYDDDVIVTSGEWEGETGSVAKVGPGYVTVRLYNHDEKIDFEPNELELNDYADSDEEEHDLRLQYGDDEYDRLHGNLGYDDLDEKEVEEGALDYSMHKKKETYDGFKQAMEKAGWGPLFTDYTNTEYGFSYVYDGFMTAAIVFVYDRIVDLFDIDLNDVEGILAEADNVLRRNKGQVYRSMDELVKDTIKIAKEHGMDPVHEQEAVTLQRDLHKAKLDRLAKEFQATMAGQGYRSEDEIIDDMLKYVDDPNEVDDIINSVHEQIENDKNVIDMVEWLKGRAGLK